MAKVTTRAKAMDMEGGSDGMTPTCVAVEDPSCVRAINEFMSDVLLEDVLQGVSECP